MLESKYLKENIDNIQKLMTIPALKNFETRSLGRLLRLSKIRQYEPGERIIREGDRDPWLYFMLSGKVRIMKKGVEITIIDQIGEMFGEMRIVDSKSRSATVQAVDRTVALSVDTASDRIASDDEIAKFLLMLYRVFAEYISARLRLTNEELIKAKNEVDRLRK